MNSNAIISFLRYFNLDFKTLRRYAYTDIPEPNFEEYRRKSLKDTETSAMKSADERRALRSVVSFGNEAKKCYLAYFYIIY